MRLLLVALILLLTPAPAFATAAWGAFAYEDSSGDTCYMNAIPKRRLINNKPGAMSGETFAYITHRPAERSSYTFSYAPDYEFSNDPVTLTIDKQVFVLFDGGSAAWARKSETDRAIATAIRNGSVLTITAKRKDGAEISDIFSLTGSDLALTTINKMCGIKN